MARRGRKRAATAISIRLRTQLEGIDKRAGKQITYVVPSSIAVYTLRKEVLAGHVPGVAKQSELFRDPIGHPTTATVEPRHLCLVRGDVSREPGRPAGAGRQDRSATRPSARRLLQQIAWNAVVGEPKSGVKGTPVKVGG